MATFINGADLFVKILILIIYKLAFKNISQWKVSNKSSYIIYCELLGLLMYLIFVGFRTLVTFVAYKILHVSYLSIHLVQTLSLATYLKFKQHL